MNFKGTVLRRFFAQWQSALIGLCLLAACPLFADTVPLYTEIRTFNPDTGYAWDASRYDRNWDFWSSEPNYPDPCSVCVQDAIYHCPLDGGIGHTYNSPPGDVLDGLADYTYGTLVTPIEDHSLQVLAVSGCIMPPYNRRDTRAVCLFNMKKVRAVNPLTGAIVEAKLRFAIDTIVNWDRSQIDDKPCPTRLYIGIYPSWEQNYWIQSYDGPAYPDTPISELQPLFDPNQAGILLCEKELDIRVFNGPLGSGVLQPLTRRYLWYTNPGAAVYEVDFTGEARQIAAASADPNGWTGFTIRPSLDGDMVLVSLDGQYNWGGLPFPVGFPPTLEVKVSRTLGDLDDANGVDAKDFSIFSRQWGDSGYPAADLDTQGQVNENDLKLLAANWLQGK